jgi:predicted transcriptional regulator
MTTATGIWEIQTAIRHAIRDQIRARAHTQAELAHITGISQAQISNMISGRRRGSFLYLDELATAAGVIAEATITRQPGSRSDLHTPKHAANRARS